MPTAEVAEHFDDAAQQTRAGLLGMWLFLGTELLLFGGLFAAFAVLRAQNSEAFSEAATHLSLTLGTLNTAILLTSGLTMALTEHAVAEGRRALALYLLAATAALGGVFLAVKGYEWHHEYQKALMPILDVPFRYPGDDDATAELFFNFYYAMTGLHVVHMLVGLGMLVVTAGALWHWRDPATLKRRAPIIALYWAFVDVVWIVIFSLLYLQRA